MFVFFYYALLCVHSSVCDHLDEEEIASCFAFIVLPMYCFLKCPVILPHGAVGLYAVCDCSIS